MRYWIGAIFVSLLLGALTTIAVSWTQAWKTPHGWRVSDFFDFNGQKSEYRESKLLTGGEWMWPVNEHWPAKPEHLRDWGNHDIQTATRTEDGLITVYVLDRFSYGWPLASACYFRASGSVSPDSSTFGVFDSGSRLFRNTEPKLNFFASGIKLPTGKPVVTHMNLPIVPRPLGFAVNTVIFSVAPLLLFLCCRALRSRRRVRNGCCKRCNYDLAGLETCPECNTPAPQRAPA